ncbi:MAG: histidinol-phosphate transaminase [Trueperaceae bacterium]|nr:histidinol-phosphate transaminase [Trueperaceae bacterium]
MKLRSEVLDLPPYRFEAHGAAVKLDQNEAPEDLPEPLRRAALERLAARSWHRYPDLHPVELAERFGARHAWPSDGVVVAGGSNVLIQAATIVAGLGRRVATVTPTFSVYALQARLLGAELRELPLGAGFVFPVEAFCATVAEGCGVAFVAAPMAPTGNPVAVDDLWRVAEAADDRWLIVVDEAYGEFAGVDHDALARAHPQVVRLRTLSKAFGLAGVRLGYALADPAVATELRKALLPFSVSALQAAVAEAVLDAPDVVAERVTRTVAERERLAGALARRLGVQVHPSVANFLLFRVADAAGTYAALQRHGVLVRRQDHLPGLEGCLRVSVGTAVENDAFLAALDAALAEGSAVPEEVAHG